MQTHFPATSYVSSVIWMTNMPLQCDWLYQIQMRVANNNKKNDKNKLHCEISFTSRGIDKKIIDWICNFSMENVTDWCIGKRLSRMNRFHGSLHTINPVEIVVLKWAYHRIFKLNLCSSSCAPPKYLLVMRRASQNRDRNWVNILCNIGLWQNQPQNLATEKETFLPITETIPKFESFLFLSLSL